MVIKSGGIIPGVDWSAQLKIQKCQKLPKIVLKWLKTNFDQKLSKYGSYEVSDPIFV